MSEYVERFTLKGGIFLYALFEGEFARAFGIAEEEAFCVGTGTGQPTFSIYQVLPEIIELWGLNVQTQVESKKTSSD